MCVVGEARRSGLNFYEAISVCINAIDKWVDIRSDAFSH